MGEHAAPKRDTTRRTAHNISSKNLRKGKLGRTRRRGEYFVNRVRNVLVT
jgi:hypothetical protein